MQTKCWMAFFRSHMFLPCLWREVFNVFVQGHLQSYDPKGYTGSFTYVFSQLLSELVVSLGLPADRYDRVYRQLFELLNQCADAIRNSTLESSLVKIKRIETIFNHFLSETLKFTEEMKLSVIKLINRLETTGELESSLNARLVEDFIDNNERSMCDYLEPLTRIDNVLHLEGSSLSHPFVASMLTGGACPFMPTSPVAVTKPAVPMVKKEPSFSAMTFFTSHPKNPSSTHTFFQSLWSTKSRHVMFSEHQEAQNPDDQSTSTMNLVD